MIREVVCLDGQVYKLGEDGVIAIGHSGNLDDPHMIIITNSDNETIHIKSFERFTWKG